MIRAGGERTTFEEEWCEMYGRKEKLEVYGGFRSIGVFCKEKLE